MSYQNKSQTVKNVWDESRLGWLGCSWYEKFGPKTLFKLHKKFGENGGLKAWDISSQSLLDIGLNQQTINHFINWRKEKKLEHFSDKLDKQNIIFILPWDKNYSKNLIHSPCPPGALFWRGSFLDNRPLIAVVGTRKMSAYGKSATQTIVNELVQAGAGIVSGLAIGIDSCAHQTALDAKGMTLAVLGCGIDDESIYPTSNKLLAKNIIENHGALISELPPETKPLKHHFPQRNRIIATLSKATLVVEAGEQSGSVLTAKIALDENREVFAVPGSIHSLGSVGVHELIKQGAQLCTSGQDILKETIIAPEPNISGRPLTDEERRILDMCRTSTNLDELTRLLNFSPAVIAATCTTLEMMDALEDQDNQTYQITNKGRKMLLSSPNYDDTFDS